jgi:GR25 family glycosyltransferase involved in LPS biosynthesis
MFFKRNAVVDEVSPEQGVELLVSGDFSWVSSSELIGGKDDWAAIGQRLCDSCVGYGELSQVVAGLCDAAGGLPPAKVTLLANQLANSFIKRGRLHEALDLAVGLSDKFSGVTALHLCQCRIKLRQGRVAEVREELAQYANVTDPWIANGVLEMAAAIRHYPLLDMLLKNIPLSIEAAGLSMVGQKALKGKINHAKALLKFKGASEGRGLFNRAKRKLVSAGDAQNFPVICINLDRDAQRFLLLRALYQEIGLQPERHPGIFGASVPQIAVDSIFRSKRPLNAIGCTMSHISVWDKVSKLDDGQVVLVLEDDALPSHQYDVARLLASLPSDMDYCFVNDRAAGGWAMNDLQTYEFQHVEDANAKLQDDCRAIGGDGYLLTPKGAKKLLGMVAQDGIVHSVDWQMYALGLFGSADGLTGRVGGIVESILAKLSHSYDFNVYVASSPLVIHSPLGYTPRSYFN